MEYHQADERWGIFGMNDFESYIEQSVVKGLFHTLVPKDVVEAYQVAEYMMAHAYYHYPLYDEAYAKLLLIIEMAVKLRCKQLNIQLESGKFYKKTGQPINKVLDVLIKEMAAIEPSKGIENGLHWLREQRNNVMHPDRHGYMGSMIYPAMKIGVTVLNKIFIPANIIQQFAMELWKIQDNLKSVVHRPFVFNDRQYLVEEVEVKDVVVIDGRTLCFVVIHPITEEIAVQVEKNDYKDPETFVVDEINVDADKITMRTVDRQDIIQFSLNNHPQNIATYNHFVTERASAKRIHRWITIGGIELPTGKHNDFLYDWLHKL